MYDASVVKNPQPPENLKTANPVVLVRSKRGYSATKYDASAGKLPKTLRRQFSQKYDAKKVRNTFSTADVVILGWRLGLLADKLQENDLAAVRALSKRYAEVDRHMPFVASITITPIAKG